MMDENFPNKNGLDDFVESIKTLSSNEAQKQIEYQLEQRGLDVPSISKNVTEHAEWVAEQIAKKEVDLLKKDIFIIFGIFASLVTFIVGEINLLKNLNSIYEKVGFSFIFVSLMLGFLFGVMFLLDQKDIDKKYRMMSFVFTLFFILGLAFLLIPNLNIF